MDLHTNNLAPEPTPSATLAEKCRDTSCMEKPAVRVHGPHGLSDYCLVHAEMYEATMKHLGCSTHRVVG